MQHAVRRMLIFPDTKTCFAVPGMLLRAVSDTKRPLIVPGMLLRAVSGTQRPLPVPGITTAPLWGHLSSAA